MPLGWSLMTSAEVLSDISELSIVLSLDSWALNFSFHCSSLKNHLLTRCMCWRIFSHQAAQVAAGSLFIRHSNITTAKLTLATVAKHVVIGGRVTGHLPATAYACSTSTAVASFLRLLHLWKKPVCSCRRHDSQQSWELKPITWPAWHSEYNRTLLATCTHPQAFRWWCISIVFVDIIHFGCVSLFCPLLLEDVPLPPHTHNVCELVGHTGGNWATGINLPQGISPTRG